MPRSKFYKLILMNLQREFMFNSTARNRDEQAQVQGAAQ